MFQFEVASGSTLSLIQIGRISFVQKAMVVPWLNHDINIADSASLNVNFVPNACQ